MYEPEFTPELDPLAVKVFLPTFTVRPSPYLDQEETDRLAAAAASCPGTALTPEAIRLFAQAGAEICEKASSLRDADENLRRCFCWVRRNDKSWFEGRRYGLYDLLHEDSIPQEEKQFGGYLGRLALSIRKKLHESAEFEVYWAARRRLAERIEVKRAELRPVNAQMFREFGDRIVGAIETAAQIGRAPAGEEKEPKERTSKAIEPARERREKIVRPLLDVKEWSDHRWAIEAGKAAGRDINPNVVYDYLSGKSFPHRRHEVPLATVIGLKKLPK
jgi:hypothetical protein